jgi:hypothetical protein
MSELQIIETVLKRAAARQCWQRAMRGLWRGLLAGCLIWLLAVALFKIFPLPVLILPAAAALAGALMVAGFVTGWWRKPSLIETARFVDGRRNCGTTQHRHRTDQNACRMGLLVADAAAPGKLDPRQLLPFHLAPVVGHCSCWLAAGRDLSEVSHQIFSKARR